MHKYGPQAYLILSCLIVYYLILSYFVLSQAGSNEVLHDEIELFCTTVGLKRVKLEVYQGMVHVFQASLRVEVKISISRLSTFD